MDTVQSDVLRLTDPFPNGELRLYGLIGDPVSQVRAPHPATQLMRKAGLNGALVPLHVRAENLARIFSTLGSIENIDGLVITVPHKIAMAELVDDLSERARLVGAINIARHDGRGRWLGDIVDGLGFVRGLEQIGFDPMGAEALVVGAGGAGSAIATELVVRGAHVRVYDSSLNRATALVRRLRLGGFEKIELAERSDPGGASLVVNATPLGMKLGDPLPVDPGLLKPAMTVAEVVTSPANTALLEYARHIGCRIQFGEAMMLNQLHLMLDFFSGGRSGNRP